VDSSASLVDAHHLSPPGRASSRPRRTAAHSGDDDVEPLPHDSADAHDLISHHRSP
jgi:hypothetical protein